MHYFKVNTVYTLIQVSLELIPCLDDQTVIIHYDDVIMGAIASLIISLPIVYSTVYSDADQRKHQNSASPAFVRGIHRRPVNSPHRWPVTRKMFPFDDVNMECQIDMTPHGQYVMILAYSDEDHRRNNISLMLSWKRHWTDRLITKYLMSSSRHHMLL